MANKKFKAGDAFTYDAEGVFVIIDIHRKFVDYAYKIKPDKRWGVGSMSTIDLERGLNERDVMTDEIFYGVHQDPDAVWADYCAWRLTHG